MKVKYNSESAKYKFNAAYHMGSQVMMLNKLEPLELKEAVTKISETHKQINRKIAENYKDQLHVYAQGINNIQEKVLDFGLEVTDDYFELLLAWRKGIFGI